MKIQNKRGFTLIELMIVIAIIGILAVTLVPQLTGAQARARDTGKIAMVSNTQTVLDTYFSDTSTFPTPADATNHCLSDADGDTGDTAFNAMFSKGKAPTAAGVTSAPCTTEASLVYKKVSSGGNSNGGYILGVDLETPAKETYLSATVTSAATIDDARAGVDTPGTDGDLSIYAIVY